MYIIKGETDHQPRLDAWDKRSDLVHWEDLEGSGGEGGIGMGNTCKSMAVSFQCMTKSTTIKKKSVLIKIEKKKIWLHQQRPVIGYLVLQYLALFEVPYNLKFFIHLMLGMLQLEEWG